MINLTTADHNFCLRACADHRSTEEEREFLSTMASLAAAGEPVSRDDYNRVQRLTGGHLSRDGSIFDRPKTSDEWNTVSGTIGPKGGA